MGEGSDVLDDVEDAEIAEATWVVLTAFGGERSVRLYSDGSFCCS